MCFQLLISFPCNTTPNQSSLFYYHLVYFLIFFQQAQFKHSLCPFNFHFGYVFCNKESVCNDLLFILCTIPLILMHCLLGDKKSLNILAPGTKKHLFFLCYNVDICIFNLCSYFKCSLTVLPHSIESRIFISFHRSGQFAHC